MDSSRRFARRCPICHCSLVALEAVGIEIVDEKTGTCAKCILTSTTEAMCPNQAEEPVSKTGSCGFESHRGYNDELSRLCREYVLGA